MKGTKYLMAILSDKLKELRKERNMTQQKAAKLIGVSNSTLCAYERSHRFPDTYTLEKIADLYEVPTDYLLGRLDNDASINKDSLKKNERDIAIRMEQICEDLKGAKGLCFNGEPLSMEAIKLLLKSTKHIILKTQLINKNYIPNKERS